MLDGITVLNSYNSILDGVVFYIAAVMVFAVLIFIWAMIKDDLDSVMTWVIGILISLLLILIMVALLSLGNSAMSTKYYEVTIDDSVNLNEFYDKYEIVRQNGKIFTIQEK